MRDKLKYNDYVKKKNYYQGIINRIASIRLIVFIIMIISFIGKYYYYPFLFTVLFVISLLFFLLLVFFHDKYYKKYDYYVKCVEVIERYLDRESGKWREFQDTGVDFLKDSPYYYQDLDLFGNNSLFQYLSICKTLGGRNHLKNKLSNQQLSSSKLLQEQESIQEISQKLSFLIDFEGLLLSFRDRKVSLSEDFTMHSKGVRYYCLGVSVIISVCSILVFILSILHIIDFNLFYGVFLFNFMLASLISSIFKNEYLAIDKFIRNYIDFEAIMNRFNQENFSSRKLNNMQGHFQESIHAGIHLKRLETLNYLKNNFISNVIFNGFFGVNFILIFMFDSFKTKDLSILKKSAIDVEELEAIGSLAVIGVVFEHKCMPCLVDEVGIHFTHLIHPLLGEDICVPNDFDTDSGVNIITGSNMGGKTSFLRTVGINLILMNSGSFVCANQFTSSYFKIFTSMRVNDDIARGISTFYGELLRMKDMIDYVDKGNMLVFIDEIFKGTNYQDRIYGAKEVIKRLNTNKTVVLLTTHDFELCEEENIRNYFVKESYDGDNIIFDYKIRKGKCTSTNARYLMKQLGIIQK